jgi:NAD(P)-dependent dehydrogenase (short-subunit alcohol dehydrogenase family)
MSKKVVFITGSSSGFGRLTAENLALKGYTVFATMRNVTGKNAEVAQALSQLQNVTVLPLDLTDEASINSAIEAAIGQAGRIDVVVNNAGVVGAGITETFTPEDTHKIFDVNFYGPIRVNRAVLPSLRKQGNGLIIHISSILGRLHLPFLSAYNASKAALEAFVESQTLELKPFGIESVVLQPGAYPTDIYNKFVPSSDLARLEEYGEVAKGPDQLFGGMGELFQSENAPNPQEVVDGIIALIEQDGPRAQRTVVDAVSGDFTRQANDAVATQQQNLYAAFGLAQPVG